VPMLANRDLKNYYRSPPTNFLCGGEGRVVKAQLDHSLHARESETGRSVGEIRLRQFDIGESAAWP